MDVCYLIPHVTYKIVRKVNKVATVNREIFVNENIHELNFLVNKFSWVPGIHKNILTRNFLSQ